MSWSAAQYAKFEDERTRPARDLLAQVPDLPAGPAFDLGCGPGNSTELILARFPGSPLTGIDSDDDMLSAARTRLPDLRFERGDLAAWTPPAESALFFAMRSSSGCRSTSRFSSGSSWRLRPAERSRCRCPTISMNRRIF